MLLFFQFLIGHAVADFALQPTAMAKGKNRHLAAETIEGQKNVTFWPYWLVSHALVHAGCVWIISKNPVLALAEFAAHSVLDFAKCEKWTNIHIDQLLHLVCKGFFVWILMRQ